jgi:hypothetical protein
VPAPPAEHQFSYAVLRVVPRVDREEFVNVGVLLYCRPLRFLGVRTELDEALLAAFAPRCDLTAVRESLADHAAVAAGERGAGPLAAMDQTQRFGWLVAPASTMVQPSPVHTGLTADPAATLERLFERLVRR